MLASLILAAVAPSLGQIKLDAKRYREAVIMLASDGVIHKRLPSSGSTQEHRFEAHGDYDLEVLAADPDASAQEGDEDAERGEPHAVAFIRKEAKRLHAANRSGGGATKTISRGAFSLTLSYRRDFAGNIRIVESSESPVVYLRTLGARAENAERALNDFTSMSYWAGGSSRTGMYPDGMPKDWTALFGSITISVPWPQGAETLPGQTEKGEGASYRFFDYNGFAMAERTDGAWEPFDRVVKRPHPRYDDFDSAGRVTVDKVDMVEHGNKWVLRQKGSSGPENDRREWIAWVAYGPGMHEWTLYARRKKGQPWSPGLPFSPDEPGVEATPDRWGEPDGVKRRAVGDLSLITAHPPTRGKEMVSFSKSGEDVVVDVFQNSEALRVRDLFLPPKDGKGLPPISAKHTDSTVDAGSQWSGDDFFSFVRLWTGKRTIFDLCAFTTQGGQPYAVHLVFMSTPEGVKGLRETLASIQGKDGKPLWPNGLGTYNWYVPGADFRLRVGGMAMYPQQTLRDVLYSDGFTVDQGKTKVGILLYAAKGNPSLDAKGWHDLHTKARGKSAAKIRSSATNLFGVDAQALEGEMGDEILTTIVKASPNDRAAVVIFRPKGTGDEVWRKLLEKSPKP